MILMVRHEFNLGHAEGNIDACLSLYAEGLKRDGVIGAADQNICATAHADRGISGNTGVPAHQNSLVDRHVRWRQNRPCKNRIVRYAGIEPELFDHALIEFALIPGSNPECAEQLPCGTEDKARAPFDAAGQLSNSDGTGKVGPTRTSSVAAFGAGDARLGKPSTLSAATGEAGLKLLCTKIDSDRDLDPGQSKAQCGHLGY